MAFSTVVLIVEGLERVSTFCLISSSLSPTTVDCSRIFAISATTV
jgi:hypothetical protein